MPSRFMRLPSPHASRFTPRVHTLCSHLVLTPCVHTSCSHLILAPRVHTSYSRLVFTGPLLCCYFGHFVRNRRSLHYPEYFGLNLNRTFRLCVVRRAPCPERKGNKHAVQSARRADARDHSSRTRVRGRMATPSRTLATDQRARQCDARALSVPSRTRGCLAASPCFFTGIGNGIGLPSLISW